MDVFEKENKSGKPLYVHLGQVGYFHHGQFGHLGSRRPVQLGLWASLQRAGTETDRPTSLAPQFGNQMKTARQTNFVLWSSLSCSGQSC